MQGIDGKFALLKMAQTHLCVKWKNLTDNNISAEEVAFLKGELAFERPQVFAFAG